MDIDSLIAPMGEEVPLADSVVAVEAVEVAAALAPEPQQPAVATAAAVKEPVRESHEGVKLHLSSRSPTGYRGVRKERLRYRAEVWSRGKHRNLGTFGSAVDAAVAYARAAAEKPAADEASVTVAATLAVDGVAVDAIAASSSAAPPGAADGVEVTATPEVVATADGLQLHLCAKNPTGLAALRPVPSVLHPSPPLTPRPAAAGTAASAASARSSAPKGGRR